jgi:hypothetical protein
MTLGLYHRALEPSLKEVSDQPSHAKVISQRLIPT